MGFSCEIWTTRANYRTGNRFKLGWGEVSHHLEWVSFLMLCTIHSVFFLDGYNEDVVWD